MINPNCCFIKEQFFIEHPHFQKMLDTSNTSKQSKRTHICIKIEMDSNIFYVPLRNNLGDAVRKFGRIGHSIPSKSRPNAGLDFRYALIINDSKYIEPHITQKLPNSQYKAISCAYHTIMQEFSVYLRGYKKAAAKGRADKEPLYRESSLVNFHKELQL
ncbi:MAG: hypothetical protein HFH26_01210 [Clostridiaceae bacterium]|nr:hypothetical protein [Clostridiaceae bacterium]